MGLRLSAYAAMLAFVLTTLYVVWPSPYLMLVFAFFAQPLFLLAGVVYLGHVFRELRRKDVI